MAIAILIIDISVLLIVGSARRSMPGISESCDTLHLKYTDVSGTIPVGINADGSHTYART